jgi:tetratricopeptide (TPR) repeat protein
MAELVGATHEKYGRGGTNARLMALQNEAVVRFNMGEIKASTTAIEDVRKRRQAIQGDASEPLSMTITYADRLVRLGRLKEGLDLARTASTRARTSGNTLWLLYSLRTMCIAYIELGRLSEAESTLQETAIALGTGTPIDLRFLGALDRLRGLLALKRGDAAAALQSANASIAAMGGGAKLKPTDERASLNLAARAALASGQPADAERYARQLLGVAEGVARGPETSADVGEALLLLAQAEIAQGRVTEAQPLLERAARCLTNGLGAEHALTLEALALSTRNKF